MDTKARWTRKAHNKGKQRIFYSLVEMINEKQRVYSHCFTIIMEMIG